MANKTREVIGVSQAVRAGAKPINIDFEHVAPAATTRTDTGVHLAHCYQGEYESSCKYGDSECPAKPDERPQTMCETGTCGHQDCHELAMGVRPATPVTVFQPLSNCVSSHEHLPCALCGYDTGPPVAATGGDGGRSPLPWRARTDGLVVSGSGNVRFILRMERHGIAATLDDEDKACLNLLLNAVNAHASTLARVRELEEGLESLRKTKFTHEQIISWQVDRIVELEGVLRELLSASIEVMVEKRVEDKKLRAANSVAMRVLAEGGREQ